MEKKQLSSNDFITPERPLPNENYSDSGKGSDTSMSSNDQNSPNSEQEKEIHTTPAIIKLRKATKELNIHSPSDSMLSPCTQKLFGNQLKGKKTASHPLNILRMRHQQMFPSTDNNN
uniref:Uncharacterized protein n=1 Tax=Parastrongyloides trichosuri TaxID=131310 RepID=A0A0N4Z128_PARTI